MKTPSLAALLISTATATAIAQPAPETETQPAPPKQEPMQVALTIDAPSQPQPLQQPTQLTQDGGWHAPVGRRFLHGFRLGYSRIANFNAKTRNCDVSGMKAETMCIDGKMSIKDKFGLKTENMMLLGYEGFYRIVGHSWLNVLLVGNVSVAGLEQSKFIPAASGLIGFEFDQSFQLGVGVNMTPDPEAPTHMIAAAGWTPNVGDIQMPVHFFVVPDTEKNHRMGVTVGVTW